MSGSKRDAGGSVEALEVRRGRKKYRGPLLGELRELRQAERSLPAALARLEADDVLVAARGEDALRGGKDALRGGKDIGGGKDIDGGDDIRGGDAVRAELLRVKQILEGAADRAVSRDEARRVFAAYAFATDGPSQLACQAPRAVAVVGSLLAGCVGAAAANTDMFVLMPASSLRREDRHAFRYHDKRVLYMAYLAETLLEHDPSLTLESHLFAGSDLRKPVLAVQTASGLRIRLWVGFAQGHNKLVYGKFLPHVDDSPYLNASMAEDTRLVAHAELLHHVVSEMPIVRDAIVLIKHWLHLSQLYQVFNGFLASMLCCYLHAQGRFVGATDALGVFRIFLSFVADEKSFEGGLFWPAQEDEEEPVPESVRATFRAAFEVVFVDPSGVLNLASRLTVGVLSEVRIEAQAALHHLASQQLGSVFAQRPDFRLRWDYLVEFSHRLKLTDELKAALKGYRKDFHRYFGWRPLAALRFLDILRRGLAGRCTALSFRISDTADQSLTIGVRLNASHAFRKLDAGPPATEKEKAQAFRDFWGSKAELRRFRDGSIIESVVWDCPFEKQNEIPEQIIRHLLLHHFSVHPSSILGNQLEVVVPRSGELESLRILNIFNDLSQKVRTLENVPLAVNDVWAIDPVLRVCGVFPPEESVFAEGRQLRDEKRQSLAITPVQFFVRYVDSSAWPDDAEARSHLMAAFRLKTRQELARLFQITSVLQDDCLDILFQGFVFRMRMVVGKESTEFKAAMKNEALHASAILGFQMKHNTFGQTVRLALRWLDSHLLSDKIPQQAVELSVAAVFAESVPSSPMFGFLRWLRLMTSYSWKTEPLLVSINGETLQDSDVEAGRRLMERKKLSPCFISDLDNTSFWSRFCNPVAWKRACLLAKHASRVALEAPLSLFVHNFADYDFVIHLHHAAIPNYARNINLHLEQHDRPRLPAHVPWTISNMKRYRRDHSELLIGFDPVRDFLKELEERLGVFCTFWFDANGGDKIGVVLKPGNPKATRVAQMGCHNKKGKFDPKLLPEYVVAVGADMVVSVDSKKN